ncbi:MAG: type I-C CRISPR-associated protein Cas5c [Chthoniobacterales bacterium]
MAYGIKLRVWGEFALFSRPEMKAERVSYDVPTPSAARGILEAIYWKPQIRWVIDRIHVLAPIRFTNIRRNEVAQKIPYRSVTTAMNSGEPISLAIEDYRQQRASLLVRDVDYVFEAHFEVLDRRLEKAGPEMALKDCEGKHLDMFNRRARSGQFHHAPVLGCREFPAKFSLIEGEVPQSELKGEQDLGFMLYDIDFANAMTPIFYRAQMIDGIIDVRSCFENSRVNR